MDKTHFEKREEQYMDIISKYDESERMRFPKLCGIVVNAFEENKNRDFLGNLYMTLDLGSHWKGQFFTPYSICCVMTEINISEEDITKEIKDKGYITVNDPACGAGATLIAFANIAERNLMNTHYNWQRHILFTAQDIDMITGLMCYIQLSLIGCAGYVKIGDTLSSPMTDGEAMKSLYDGEYDTYWYTPMYFNDAWVLRRFFK